MNIRKIILEEIDDFDWIRDTTNPFDIKESRKIWLGNVDDENVKKLIQSFKEMGWRGPTTDTIKMSTLYLEYGGGPGFDNIIGWMGCRKPDNQFWGKLKTDCIEIDGKWYNSDKQLKKDREYFDRHEYKEYEGTESLFEQEGELDWIKDIPSTPHSIIIDTEKSTMSTLEIMELLYKAGFTWSGGDKIFKKDGDLRTKPFRWIYVGPMEYSWKDSNTVNKICDKCIMHDDKNPHEQRYTFNNYDIITL